MSTPVPQKTLTRFANGKFTNSASPNADFLAPTVSVPIATFSFPNYAKRSGFQTPASARAIGGKSNSVQSDGDLTEVSLKPHGLNDFIDDHEKNQAGTEFLPQLRQSRVDNLVSQASNARFKETITIINETLNSPIASNWGTSGVNPIEQIDGLLETVSNSTGFLMNNMMFSLTAWRIFRNNADVIARFPGMLQISVTEMQTTGFFINPNMKMTVCDTVFDTKMNATSVKGNAIASDVYIFYKNEDNTYYDNSFAKTFRIGGEVGATVRTSQKDHGELVLVDWTEAIFVNNAAVGKRLAVTES